MSRRGPHGFFRDLVADNHLRVRDRRRLGMDAARYVANSVLRPLEALVARRLADSRRGVIFVVGSPRSGTTLLHQLLARHAEVAYVDNRLARWWMAPVVASLALGTAAPSPEEIPLRSHLGATEGPRSPHEFSYFWRYWLGSRDSDHLDETELAEVDWAGLGRELTALASRFRRPLVLKNLNFVDYQIALLARALPGARFLHVRRDPRFVVQSILASRVARYGAETTWWSVRPRDWRSWTSQDPLEQVIHQVRDLETHVGRALSRLAPTAHLEVGYEALAEAPEREILRVAEWIGVPVRQRDQLAGIRLEPSRSLRLSAERVRIVEERFADG